MKAIISAAAVAALATFTLMRAFGADAPGRPPGVSASQWAPISNTMGIVLVNTQMAAGDAPIDTDAPGQGARPGRTLPSGAGGGAALISPVSGYLMVKRGSIWQRLIMIEPVKGPGAAG